MPPVTIKLDTPMALGKADKPTDTLALDLESLTGADLVAAEREFMAARPGFVGVPGLCLEYQMCLAARALHCPVDDVKALPLRVCSQVLNAVDRFLS